MGSKIWHIGVSRENKKYIIFSEKTDNIALYKGFVQAPKGYKTKEGALSAVKVRFPLYKPYTENKNSISKLALNKVLTSTSTVEEYKNVQSECVENVEQNITEIEDIDDIDFTFTKENTEGIDAQIECIENVEQNKIEIEDVDNIDFIFTSKDMRGIDDQFSMEDYLIHKILRLDINTLKDIFNDGEVALVCVDGAYKAGTGKSGYAYAIVTDGEIYMDSGLVKLDKPSSTKTEMIAVKHALSKVLALGINEVFLAYDCAYVTGVFEVKNISQCCSETKEYLKFIDLVSKVINIHWVKVKGHSGIPIHTQVDVAAGMRVGRII